MQQSNFLESIMVFVCMCVNEKWKRVTLFYLLGFNIHLFCFFKSCLTAAQLLQNEFSTLRIKKNTPKNGKEKKSLPVVNGGFIILV